MALIGKIVLLPLCERAFFPLSIIFKPQYVEKQPGISEEGWEIKKEC